MTTPLECLPGLTDRPSTLQLLLSSSAQSEGAPDVAHNAYSRVVDACREGGAWLQSEGVASLKAAALVKFSVSSLFSSYGLLGQHYLPERLLQYTYQISRSFQCDEIPFPPSSRHPSGDNTHVMSSCTMIAGSSVDQVSTAIHDLRKADWYGHIRADEHILVADAFLRSTA